MSGSFWRPSGEQRRTILLLEALGLIHDLGKLSDQFLESQEQNPKVEYIHNLLADPRQIDIYKNHTAIPGDRASGLVSEWLNDAGSKPAAFQGRSDLTALLMTIQFDDWTGKAYSFAELMPLVARPSLARSPSAISKSEWLKVLGKEMHPGLLVGYLHGPAHIDKEGEPKHHKQPYSDVFRATPFGLEERIGTGADQELTIALNNLPMGDMEQITSDQRRKWLEAMKEQMSCGLADNRRPHNEVSLWDWGYTAGTLAKAAAAWIYKHGWPAGLDGLPYRTLRINLNRLERYTRCDKIGDLLGVRQVLDEAFKKVQTLLEETNSLGNCFYHDETGAYYLFPDLQYSGEEMAALRQEIQAQFPPDLRPQVHLGEPVTAGELDDRSSSHDPKAVRKLVAEPRVQALQEAAVCAGNNIYLFETEWGKARPENAEKCNACGIHPVGYPRQGSCPEVERELATWATQAKAERRSVCRICLDRRGRRAEDWAKNGLQGTIWTDEVADDNGRVALFIGKLGLEGWLDGLLLSTIQVTADTLKSPSPARLYRIAETGRSFWRQVSDNLTPDTVGQRPFRLALYPASDNLSELGDFHAYELEVDGLALGVLWDKPNGRFLTVENLAYLARRWHVSQEELADRLQGCTFDVLEPSEFMRPGKALARVQVENVKTIDGYLPVIPLLAEPGVYMTLVPAAKAVTLARAVKREYEKQMGRVRDRLPLYLGLVFCHRHTPLRAVLEAGRAMLNMGGGDAWEDWRLRAKNSPSPGERELIFDHGITWRIPVLAGDCKTEDQWYPRMYEGDSWERRKATHVKDLRVRDSKIPRDRGWKVWVRPSRFDFEFLDTTGRRFEIYYGPDGRRPRRTRPFYLEDLDRLDTLWDLLRRLAVSQRHQVISTIEATRERWYGQDGNDQSRSDAVFRQFVADTLAGATWPKGQPWATIQPEWQEKLMQAGVSGELADLAELYMEILKE
ncbi:hypothetical protein SY88_07160 [Clostridiales bacterium PH28_bin88]|nr:hypothetical protein SY88_07160 [Clostridiales bacterium PH28_bin88]